MVEPPAVVVIFRSKRRADDDGSAYSAMAERLGESLAGQEGFLGMDSVRDTDTGHGITVCYCSDEDCVRAWRDNVEHRAAQARGIAEWYESYEVIVAAVARAYLSAIIPRTTGR